MTYIKAPFSYPLSIKAFHNCSATALSVNSVIKPQSNETLAGSPQCSITTSSGIISLPNTQCLLIGSVTYRNYDWASYVRYRWYDNTNSQYIGSIGQIRGLDEDRYTSNTVGPISCDEEAICIAQNIDVKLVVTGISSNDLYIDGSHSHDIYAGKTRLLVYEF